MRTLITIFSWFIFREYADEALRQGKVLTEVAREIFEDVAAETIKSKFTEIIQTKHKLHFDLFIGANEFASEALRATSEYASQAGEILQEKVPEAFEGILIDY